MMYYMRASAGQSRAIGVTAVVLLHIAIGVAILSVKRPETIFSPAPVVLELMPEIMAPEKAQPEPVVTEDLSLTETTPLDTFELPEITLAEPAETVTTLVPAETATPTVTIPTVPTTGTEGGSRTSAQLPGRLEKPPYPRTSRQLNEQGITTVEACISERGAVSSARLLESSGFARLDEAAVKWVRGLRNFTPATVNGRRVPECMALPIEWTITDR